MNDLPNVVQFSSVESYLDDTKIFSCPSRLRMLTSLSKESLKTSVMSPSGAAQLNCSYNDIVMNSKQRTMKFNLNVYLVL